MKGKLYEERQEEHRAYKKREGALYGLLCAFGSIVGVYGVFDGDQLPELRTVL